MPTQTLSIEGDYSQERDLLIEEYEIVSSPNDFNIRTIYDFIKSGTVKIPVFQRNFTWDLKRASKLIESILMGLPIPQLFLYEQSRNEFLVIDGQQRLMSIYYFMEKRFPRPEKRYDLRRIFAERGRIPESVLHNDEYFTDFNLKIPEDIPGRASPFNGLNYSTLDEFQTTFNLRTIRNIIIKQTHPEGDDSCIYEIYNRLNTGGVNLRPQEIRMSLYISDFYNMLSQINLNERWRAFLGTAHPDIYMKDIEILLRGFAMLVAGQDYRPSMLRFLNRFSRQYRAQTAEQVNYHKQLFESFLESCRNLPDNAFYGQRPRFNISVFESVFRAICHNAFREHTLAMPQIEPEKLHELKRNQDFINSTVQNIASAANVRTRLELAEQILID